MKLQFGLPLICWALLIVPNAEASMLATYRLQPNAQIVPRCALGESLLRMDLPSVAADLLAVTFQLQLCTAKYGDQHADLVVNLPRAVFDVPSLLEMTLGQSRTESGVSWTREANPANGLAWYSLRFDQPPVSGLVTLESVSFAVAAGRPRNLGRISFGPGATVWNSVSVRLHHRFAAESFLLRGSRVTSLRRH